jgi:hypothetical protein
MALAVATFNGWRSLYLLNLLFLAAACYRPLKHRREVIAVHLGCRDSTKSGMLMRQGLADFFTGLGSWTRANPEQCLLATRGKPLRALRTFAASLWKSVANTVASLIA